MRYMKDSQTAEIILYNGSFASDDLQNPIMPEAQAVAIGDGTIIAVGTNEDILQFTGPATEKIDLSGRLVVPGFIDTHIHFYEWALKRQDLLLDELTCLDDLLTLIAQTAKNLAPGQWVMGQGWNETDWTVPQKPSREALDKAAPHHPVLLWRCDLHLAVANSAALDLAGINAATPDPPDGKIERDAEGEPTGILRELAINLMRQAFTTPSAEQITEAFTEGTKALHRLGITGIHDIRLMADSDGARAFQCFQKLEQDNRLDLRCWLTLPGHLLDDIIGLGLRTGFGSDRLRIGHVKYFSDGGMGARTAWMIDPYLDAEYGMPLMDMKELASDITKADEAGLSVMVHAVGDRANRELINIFEALEAERTERGVPALPIPHRIEHVQMIRPEDAARLRNLNLALCLTPVNMVLDFNLIDSAVAEKGKYAYNFRQLMDTGAPVMFSSDCPVCNPDPLLAIHAAVTRQRTDGTPREGWYPESRVSAAEALAAYTSTPAAVHRATDIGIIAAGNKADLAVLSENILTQPPASIAKTKVEMTLFNGRIVHRLM